ncbi:MAG TPA: ATP-binding protein [Usitatibacter sp.]|nr:ATP-binding protein [Usitatibacter sp.]
MTIRLLTVALHVQADLVGARQRARDIAALLGFDVRQQTSIATSVSEIARNAFRYAGGGKVEFEVEGQTAPQLLVVRVSDDGPGIGNLDEVMDGTYRSQTGMGIGLIGSRRLMDRWEINSVPGRGTVVTLGKLLPDTAEVLKPADAGKLVAQLGALPAATSLVEMQSQNAELLRALADLQDKQDRLLEMTRELEDTNRGVVALYAELDEKATHLRRADEMKSRFLSNMSHEFRTPLNSMRALCGMLLAKIDGPLAAEQETQVKFIAKASDDLSDLVNDLLDLAKIEAGKVEVHPAAFEVEELFSALRGMLRPLLVSETVDLVIEEPEGIPPMFTDETKVSQILRNYISNALKFTERGTVRVRATLSDDRETVLFAVSDTGIGIALEDREMVFEEFTQVPSALQRRVKGTGLGLPLCRKLATLLGGYVFLESEPGVGSTFFARVPVRFTSVAEPSSELEGVGEMLPPAGPWVLIVEDDEATRAIYERFLKGSEFGTVAVPTLAEARAIVARHRPLAVILDILLPGEEHQTWRWLTDTRAIDDPIPVIVASSAGDSRKAMSLGAAAHFEKPVSRDALLARLREIAGEQASTGHVALIIDDDAAARYVIRRSVRAAMRFEEASGGAEGLAAASRLRPEVIFLDLAMPGMNGAEVLDRLKADPVTAAIPVVVVTSHDLDDKLRTRLSGHAQAIMQKKDISVETLARTLEAIHQGATLP